MERLQKLSDIFFEHVVVFGLAFAFWASFNQQYELSGNSEMASVGIIATISYICGRQNRKKEKVSEPMVQN